VKKKKQHRGGGGLGHKERENGGGGKKVERVTGGSGTEKNHAGIVNVLNQRDTRGKKHTPCCGQKVVQGKGEPKLNPKNHSRNKRPWRNKGRPTKEKTCKREREENIQGCWGEGKNTHRGGCQRCHSTLTPKKKNGPLKFWEKRGRATLG